MDSPIDTAFDVACSWHEGRWYATVAEPPATAPIADLLMLDVSSVYDVPFAVADLVATRRRLRPWRLRLLGLDLPAFFTGGRTADRIRTEASGKWAESWTARVDGEVVIVALRSLRID